MAEKVFERLDRLERKMAEDYADVMSGFTVVSGAMERYYADTKHAMTELRKLMANFEARLTAIERKLAARG